MHVAIKKRDVSFVTKDLMMDEDAAEFIEGQGIRTSPVLQLGESLLHGNDLEPSNIDALLGLVQSATPTSP